MMNTRSRSAPRPVTVAQMVGVLAFALALFFVVAFVTKARDAYQLRAWRAELQADVSDLLREQAELELEIERRQSPDWVASVLRDAGMVKQGETAVIPEWRTPVPAVPAAIAPAAAESVATPIPSPTETPPAEQSAPMGYWHSWEQLIFGFDE